jgi:hypothetical protein
VPGVQKKFVNIPREAIPKGGDRITVNVDNVRTKIRKMEDSLFVD